MDTIKTNYDRFELESPRKAPMRVTSLDIRRVQLECQLSRMEWEYQINTELVFSIGLINIYPKFVEAVQNIIKKHSESFNCCWSRLFVPMPLRFDPNTDPHSMRSLVIDELKNQIDCSNYLLHEDVHAGQETRLKLREQIEATGDSHKAIEDEANRLLIEHLKKQLTVRTRC